VTPQLPAAELAALGFHMIVYPLSGLFAATKAMGEVYERLRRDGDTAAVRERLVGFDAFNAIIGLDEKYALDATFKDE
jgi:2-methylisocitrate lyase-like PEP mutase family enzyme